MEFTDNLPEIDELSLNEDSLKLSKNTTLDELYDEDHMLQAAAGQDRQDQQEDDELLEQTQEILDNIKPEDIEKYKEFQKLMLAMGIPACKIMLNTLISHASCSDNVNVMKKKVEELSSSSAGGMQIKYYNFDTEKHTFAYIIVNKCGKDHDIMYQLNKIYKYLYKPPVDSDSNNEVPNPEWQEVLKYISMMIYLCRNIYETTAKACKQEIENLKILNEDGSPKDIEELMKIHADPVTTILHLVPEWEERLGVYITTEDELES